MKTYQPTNRKRSAAGFTLVELLVVITVIGILVGMLAVGVQQVLKRTREFAIQTDMTQMESAIEKFKIEYGFYPPSFKNMNINTLLTYINRVAPSHLEGVGATGSRPIDSWWAMVGNDLVVAANSNQIDDAPGSDLVFWLSGLSKNKQHPLSDINGNTIAAHNFVSGGDGVERQVFFDFKPSQIVFSFSNNLIATYVQPSGRQVPYLYRDAGANFLPNNPSNASDATGAYVNSTFVDLTDFRRPPVIGDIVDAGVHLGGANPNGITNAESQAIFNRLYPNADSFQLISFGLDGVPGGPQTCDPSPFPPNPNVISKTCSGGADNMVNFGSDVPGRLENIVLDAS